MNIFLHLDVSEWQKVKNHRKNEAKMAWGIFSREEKNVNFEGERRPTESFKSGFPSRFGAIFILQLERPPEFSPTPANAEP